MSNHLSESIKGQAAVVARGHALVTGGAGFIGSHLVDSLLEEGWQVTVLDNFDPYYPKETKLRNLSGAGNHRSFRLMEGDIRDLRTMMNSLHDDYDVIVHLGAKAGVRPSIIDPVEYQEVNVAGTQNVLEFAKRRGVEQFVFASSSSVYGVNPNVPWREDDYILRPISPYASTKVSGELLGHVYSHLYGIRFIALRFFTVYGPRQRPDLAIHKFARLILAGRSIPMFGDGTTRRDYTFVSDIITGIRAAMTYKSTSYEVINLGNDSTVSLAEMISTLESVLGCEAKIDQLPDQPGDVPRTWANIDKARQILNYSVNTEFKDGVERLCRSIM